ncbi:MAG: acylneuraminate cytidylyltransferase family protein, partial [Chloroflexota bacterium]
LTAIIPVRGGSKGIPRKNLAPLLGKPLIAWTAAAALASRRLDRVVVSTDDAEIAAVARECGLEVPFMRPGSMARDQSGALEVIAHALQEIERRSASKVDAVVYLQPTSPLRTAGHIDRAVEMYAEKSADTVVSVCRVPHNLASESQLSVAADGRVAGANAALLLRRQDKPVRFARNGPAVLVVSRACVLERQTLYGERTFALEMTARESMDIDAAEDLDLAEAWLRWSGRGRAGSV